MFRRLPPRLALPGALALGRCSEIGTEPMAPLADDSPEPSSAAIAAVASRAGLTELVAALGYVNEGSNAGFVDLLVNGRAQYTVFAPTSAAPPTSRLRTASFTSLTP